jgi:hypothetical protein
MGYPGARGISASRTFVKRLDARQEAESTPRPSTSKRPPTPSEEGVRHLANVPRRSPTINPDTIERRLEHDSKVASKVAPKPEALEAQVSPKAEGAPDPQITADRKKFSGKRSEGNYFPGRYGFNFGR